MYSLDPKYLQRLVETSPDIIVAVDIKGTVVYYNDGARRGLQYTAEEIIGQNVARLYPSKEEARRVMTAMRNSKDNNGRISSFESIFRNKNNEDIPVAISASLIYDDDNNEIGSIGFARDVRGMRRREQLATAGEIAISLAHEINNPLEVITNNLELLARDVESRMTDAELVVESERLDSIRCGVGRVQAIVRRLDEMARKGTYETRDYLQGKRMADLAPREGEVPVHEHDTAGPVREWPLTGMSVLVLDDDPGVLNSLADLLKAERCTVYTAARPSSALAVLRNVKVDAIISDVVMPEMDGYEFYLQVKEELPDLPVILMTAYYYDKDHIIKRSRLRGLEGALFKKPINPAKLRQVLLQVRNKTVQPQKGPVPVPADAAPATAAANPPPVPTPEPARPSRA
ncbi:MAG: response regulator [Candidatus Binataceae bacterium]